MRLIIFASLIGLAFPASAEIQVINGVKYECKDGMCRIVDEDQDENVSVASFVAETGAETTEEKGEGPAFRIVQGYTSADDFVRFLRNDESSDELCLTTPVSSVAFWVSLLAILLGGLAMNLTPCVLPMIPINLLVIGKSASRGVWYGLGIALAYGSLGVLAAVGGLAFGTIQGSPWFNVGSAGLFILLTLALSGAFFIDLSKPRGGLAQKKATMLPWLFAFFMGGVSAVLAGACVAPILISVLLLTGKLYAEGRTLALGLPFVLGLGMALPWPFLGAGLKVLPRPGAWMKWVNRLFALLLFGFAIWYGRLAWLGFTRDAGKGTGGERMNVTPETFNAALSDLRAVSTKPILVDCWATWCKNCSAMDKVLEEPEVKKELEGFTVFRLQAEDMRALNALKGFETIRGLPAFVIIERGDGW